jgi:1-acyl-sn-glycerol-3-phosphate acyltransferase
MLISSPIFDLVFKLTGWTLEGAYPDGLKKSIIIVAPHASWIDFPVGLGARSMMKIPIIFWGKKELFEGIFGWMFRWLGGYPVDRKNKSNLVDSIVDIYAEKETFVAVLAPEGTRKDVQELRTGFYYIAIKAQIPIVMIGFDFVNKIVKIREPFYPVGEFEVDKKVIAEYFSTIPGVQKSWIKNYLA